MFVLHDQNVLVGFCCGVEQRRSNIWPVFLLPRFLKSSAARGLFISTQFLMVIGLSWLSTYGRMTSILVFVVRDENDVPRRSL
jgi:hypothetical protein